MMSWFLNKVFYLAAPTMQNNECKSEVCLLLLQLNSFNSFLTLAQSFHILAIYVSSSCQEPRFPAFYSTVITKSFKFKQVYKC